MTTPTRHPRWCDPQRCTTENWRTSKVVHRSHQFQGAFDPQTGSTLLLSLCQLRGGYTYLLIQCADDRCDGHELSPRQMRELHEATGIYLAQLEPEDHQPAGRILLGAPID